MRKGRRNFIAIHGTRRKIHEAILNWPRWISGSGLIVLMEKFIERGWPGVTAHPHRFGVTEYRLGKRELGHIHGDQLVDIPLPNKVRDKIIAAGRAEPTAVGRIMFCPIAGGLAFFSMNPPILSKHLRCFDSHLNWPRSNDRANMRANKSLNARIDD